MSHYLYFSACIYSSIHKTNNGNEILLMCFVQIATFILSLKTQYLYIYIYIYIHVELLVVLNNLPTEINNALLHYCQTNSELYI